MFGSQIIVEAGSYIEAKVSSVLTNGKWCWRPPRADAVWALQNGCCQVVIHDNDKLIWTSSHTGEYSCSSAWEIWRFKSEKVGWRRLIWDRFVTPKHVFIMRLAVKNWLTTCDRMLSWGWQVSPLCFSAETEWRVGIIFSLSVLSPKWCRNK